MRFHRPPTGGKVQTEESSRILEAKEASSQDGGGQDDAYLREVHNQALEVLEGRQVGGEDYVACGRMPHRCTVVHCCFASPVPHRGFGICRDLQSPRSRIPGAGRPANARRSYSSEHLQHKIKVACKGVRPTCVHASLMDAKTR